jgi:hypothetical protein
MSVALKLLALSLFVGLGLSAFDIRPETLLVDLGGTVRRIFEVTVNAVKWAVPYVLVGAVVVVPIWLIVEGFRLIRRRRK